VHQDTIRSIKDHLGPQTSAVKCKLKDLKLKDLPNIVGSHDPRNAPMIAALKARLVAFDDNGIKAFAAPFYKPDKGGNDTVLVRSIKLKDVQKGGVPVRGGVADQASMWRVDVFCKAGKYYMVPIYQSDRRKGGMLPNRASTANTARSEWTLIDDTFEFKFSLQSNDLIRLNTKKEKYLGYFAGLNVANSSISIHSHARFEILGKDGTWTSLGVKTGVETFEKLNVDVLGNFYPITQQAQRGGLA
jgi:CRISPR-associated endonuclease Csn1